MLSTERRRLAAALLASLVVHAGVFTGIALQQERADQEGAGRDRTVVTVRIHDVTPDAPPSAESSPATQDETTTPVELPPVEPEIRPPPPPAVTPVQSESPAAPLDSPEPPPAATPEELPKIDTSITAGEAREPGNEGNRSVPTVPMPSIVQPRPVSPITPEYPLAARRRGYEGEVVIRVYVSPRGYPVRMEIVRGTAYRQLNAAALAAVEAAVFQPGTVDAVPVEMPVNVRVRFELTGDTWP